MPLEEALLPHVGLQSQPLWTLEPDFAHKKAPSGHESERFGRQVGVREERKELVEHRIEPMEARQEPIRDL